MTGKQQSEDGAPLRDGIAIMNSQPFSVMIGTIITALSDDGAQLELPITSSLRQQHGFVHGGVVSYLADNALTYAGGHWLSGQIVTSEFKINYVRPAVGDRLIARAQAVAHGRTQAVARCDIFAVAGGVEKLCAAAQGTIVAMAPRDR